MAIFKKNISSRELDVSIRIKTASDPYGWWLSPEGKLYEVPVMGHERFARIHPEIFGESHDPYTDLMDNGEWIRLVSGDTTLTVDIPNRNFKYIRRIQNAFPNMQQHDVVVSWPKAKFNDILFVSKQDFMLANSMKDLEIINKNASLKIAQKKRILMLVAPVDFQDQEYAVPKKMFDNAGFDVDVASSTELPKSMTGRTIKANLLFEKVDPSKYDAVVAVGGKGAKEMGSDPNAQRIVKEMSDEDKLLAGICHGPLIFARSGLTKDKVMTGWPESKNEFEELGASYTGQEVEDDHGFITGRDPDAAQEFAKIIIDRLLGKEKTAISKRAAEEEKTPVVMQPMLTGEEAERSFNRLMELSKKRDIWERDKFLQQKLDIRNPKPQEVMEYFLFKHYKNPKYKPYNPEMLDKLLEVQPSKYFDANLFMEKEFEPYVENAVEAIARLEPQYFVDTLVWWLPRNLTSQYLDLAKESLKSGKTLEERRDELLRGEKGREIMKKWKEGSVISKRAARLLYPKKMLNEIYEWAMQMTPDLKKGLFGKPKKETVAKYFDIDLSDMGLLRKRPELAERFENAQNNGWYKKLCVILYANKDPRGQEASYVNTEIGVPEIHLYDLGKMKDLRSSVAHELTHMMQSILTTLVWPTAKGKPVGLPGNYDPEVYKMYGKIEDFDRGDDITVWHSRSDIEFFSKLNEEIENALNYVTPAKDKHKAFEKYIRRSKFLGDLRYYNEDRYKKALRELYRAFDMWMESRQTKISCRKIIAKDPLSKYKKKRKFDKTPEPEGKVEKGKNKHRFVIQRHKAEKAGEHYDLRIENDEGTMNSWAIPRHSIPSKNDRFLAMATENHPISYMTFGKSKEEHITEGYGKGSVRVVASGKYKPISWNNKKIEFEISSGKAKGKFVLVHTDGKKWLWMRAKD